MTCRLALRGAGIGLIVAALLALWDRMKIGALYWGLGTAIIGVTIGGIALVMAFLMALMAYLLARGNRAPAQRKWLVAAAIVTGAAGMTCGLGTAALWLANGHPWFP